MLEYMFARGVNYLTRQINAGPIPCGRVNYPSHGPLKVQTDSGERRGIMIESAAKGSALSSGGLDEAAQAAGV